MLLWKKTACQKSTNKLKIVVSCKGFNLYFLCLETYFEVYWFKYTDDQIIATPKLTHDQTGSFLELKGLNETIMSIIIVKFDSTYSKFIQFYKIQYFTAKNSHSEGPSMSTWKYFMEILLVFKSKEAKRSDELAENSNLLENVSLNKVLSANKKLWKYS